MSQQPFYADLDRWRGILPTKKGNLGKGILKIVNFVYKLLSVLTRYIIETMSIYTYQDLDTH